MLTSGEFSYNCECLLQSSNFYSVIRASPVSVVFQNNQLKINFMPKRRILVSYSATLQCKHQAGILGVTLKSVYHTVQILKYVTPWFNTSICVSVCVCFKGWYAPQEKKWSLLSMVVSFAPGIVPRK